MHSSHSAIGWGADEELEWDTQMVYLSHYAQHATEQSEETFAQLLTLADRAQARINRKCPFLSAAVGTCPHVIVVQADMWRQLTNTKLRSAL